MEKQAKDIGENVRNNWSFREYSFRYRTGKTKPSYGSIESIIKNTDINPTCWLKRGRKNAQTKYRNST
ncbi:MAG: hypothetical protein HYW01_07095 [Deltaproteobacteria bacterium]|nr:hypothetical protein [Deltaproteobacteria bacterium]